MASSRSIECTHRTGKGLISPWGDGFRFSTARLIDPQGVLHRYSYTFDPRGALATKADAEIGQVFHCTYYVRGNLREVTLPDGREVHYLVDVLGRRAGREICTPGG